MVAGYRKWQSLGRQVRRGEVGIRVFGPVTRRDVTTDVAGEPIRALDGKPEQTISIVGVRPLAVFDVTQTDGDPLPQPPEASLLTGEAPPGLWDALAAAVEAEGFRVSHGDCGGANGLTIYGSNEVRVRPDLDAAAQVKTLAHELAHVLLHRPEEREPLACRGVIEVEAESVAHLVTRAHGLDSAQYTFNYVAGWAHEAARPDGPTVEDVVRRTGERVIRTAHRILDRTRPDPTDPGRGPVNAADPGRGIPADAVGVRTADLPVWERVGGGPAPTTDAGGRARHDSERRGDPGLVGRSGREWGDVGGLPAG